MEKNETKHHFLYYIFQNDKKSCMMDENREICLKEKIQKILQMFQKGE